MAYLLLWGNDAEDNYFIPAEGQDMAQDFLQMAEDDPAVFAGKARL